MSDPQYLLQIVDRDGKAITDPVRPLKQRHGALAIPLVEYCVEEILSRLHLLEAAEHLEPFLDACSTETHARLGIWRSRKKVSLAQRDGIAAALRTLPVESKPLAGAIREGIGAAIQRLKDETLLLQAK